MTPGKERPRTTPALPVTGRQVLDSTHQAEGGFPEELRQKVEPSQSILHSADISKSGLASGRKPVWPAAWRAGVKGQQGSLLKAAPWECPMGGDRRGKENSP